MKLHMPSFLVGMAAVVAVMMAVHFFARARADAGDTYLTIPFASYHMPQSSNPQRRYNENNIGIGLEHHFTDELSAGFGTYRNSLYRTSFYLGGAYMPVRAGEHVRIGLSGGFVTGYLNQPAPMIVPTVMLQPKGGVGLNLLFVPPIVGSGTPAVIGFQAKWRF